MEKIKNSGKQKYDNFNNENWRLWWSKIEVRDLMKQWRKNGVHVNTLGNKKGLLTLH